MPFQRTSGPTRVSRDVDTWQLLAPTHLAVRSGGPLRSSGSWQSEQLLPSALQCLLLRTPAGGVQGVQVLDSDWSSNPVSIH